VKLQIIAYSTINGFLEGTERLLGLGRQKIYNVVSITFAPLPF